MSSMLFIVSTCANLSLRAVEKSAVPLSAGSPDMRESQLHRGECWDTEIFGTTPFPLTADMCRRGIENRGSAAYRSAVVARIRRGKCLRIAALGGSITFGVNLCGHRDGGHAPGACGHDEDVRKNERLDGAHGKKDAWPVWLERFLNHRMPCAGGTHTVVNLAVSGKGTNFWTDKLERFKPQLAGVDMIILDAASNDVSELIGDTKATSHEWESGLLPASMIQRYTELFIRKVTAEFPEVALVWATVGWRGMGPRSKAPYHHDADSEHDDVLRYYDRDHISLLAALRPFHTKAMRSWEADTLFVDGFHLSLLGHKMVAQLVGNWLVEIGGEETGVDTIHSAGVTMAKDVQPLYLSAADASRLTRPLAWEIDFAEIKELPPAVSNTAGWALYAYRKGKQGLVAENTSASTLNITITNLKDTATHPETVVSVSLLHSYEHFGKVEVWMLNGGSKELFRSTIDCKWTTRVSLGKTYHFRIPIPARSLDGASLFFDPDVHSDRGLDHKVKLLRVQLR